MQIIPYLVWLAISWAKSKLNLWYNPNFAWLNSAFDPFSWAKFGLKHPLLQLFGLYQRVEIELAQKKRCWYKVFQVSFMPILKPNLSWPYPLTFGGVRPGLNIWAPNGGPRGAPLWFWSFVVALLWKFRRFQSFSYKNQTQSRLFSSR